MKGKHKEPKKPIVVEDHGNGYMVVGTTSYKKASRIICEYVDNPEDYRYATPTYYANRPSCWLTTGPGEVWQGARDHVGNPLPR